VWIWKTDIDSPMDDRTSKPGEVAIDAGGWPQISTGDGWIRLVTVQREGGLKVSGEVAGQTFLAAGAILGETVGAIK